MSERKINVETAANIATLSRLNVDREKLAIFAGQFNDILDYMDQLAEVDTTGVEPLYCPTDHSTVFREDKAEKRFERSQVLENAPESDGRFFVVPKIV